MVDCGLNEFYVVDFAVSIEVTHVHDSLEAVFSVVAVVVLHDLEHAEVAKAWLEFFHAESAVVILVERQESLFEVTELFLLDFEPG